MTTRRGVRGCSCVTVPLPYDPRRPHMRVEDPDCPTHRRAPVWMRLVSAAVQLLAYRRPRLRRLERYRRVSDRYRHPR